MKLEVQICPKFQGIIDFGDYFCSLSMFLRSSLTVILVDMSYDVRVCRK